MYLLNDGTGQEPKGQSHSDTYLLYHMSVIHLFFSRLSFWHKNQASPEKQKTSSACPFLHALYLYMLFQRSLGYPSFVVHRKVGDKTSESCHRSAAEATLPAVKHIKSPGYLETAFVWCPPAMTGKTLQNPTQTRVLTANKVSERKRKYKQTAFVSEVTAGRNTASLPLLLSPGKLSFALAT